MCAVVVGCIEFDGSTVDPVIRLTAAVTKSDESAAGVLFDASCHVVDVNDSSAVGSILYV